MSGAVLLGTFGLRLLGEVLRIPNNYTVIVSYRTERKPLQALLPPGLSVAGEPVVSFRARRAEGIEWADGTWLVHHRGRPLLELECRDPAGITGTELDALRAERRSGCTIGYKGLPTVDGTALGEHYATAIPTRAEVDRAWRVDGRVTLFDTRPHTALWHHHAIRALRTLPLLERLGGTGTVGTYWLDLGRAQRLT